MKRTGIILVAALAGWLMQGCKKADPANSLVPAATSSSAERYSMPNVTNMDYVLNINNTNNNNPIIWSSGYMNSTAIFFDGVYLGVDAPNPVALNYDASVDKLLSIGTKAELGNFKLPAGIYSSIKFRLQFGRGNTAHTLFLAGTGYMKNKQVAVNFVVDEDLVLAGSATNVTMGMARNTETFSLDLARITSNLDKSLLDQATMTNGTLIISAKDNPSLYALMLRNIYSAMTLQLTAATLMTVESSAGSLQ